MTRREILNEHKKIIHNREGQRMTDRRRHEWNNLKPLDEILPKPKFDIKYYWPELIRQTIQLKKHKSEIRSIKRTQS